ncbi:hypothetical protein [Sulfurimonas sp.]|uniref:hypothetical protein n=1 Tax=Sulfurimonas sp. TaxID=2022749 RepID=UPI0025F37ED3|nr:hypothetical protein [Sulfurimonas sp.]MCK9454742.1 hypothetical protein [Sulfurimonas sp.]
MDLHLTLTEIIGLAALSLVIAVFATIPYSFDDKKRDSILNFSFFAILIVIIGSVHFKNTRESLIEGFYNNKELLCKEDDEKKLIISQAKGFTLQSDYFIHEQNILYIGGCILLKETKPTEKTKELKEPKE